MPCPKTFLILFLLAITAAAQEPAFLVADLAPGRAAGDAFRYAGAQPRVPFQPAELAGRFYFAAEHPFLGVELFSSDGTPGGTALFADLCPGSCSSFPQDLRNVGGRLLFHAEHAVLGRELFVLRPGRAPALVEDVCPGPCSSILIEGFPATVTASFGKRLVFSADDGLNGLELWISDGTPRGTRRLTDFCPGPCDAFFWDFQAGPDRLYFAVDFPDLSRQPATGTTDGTARGSRLLPRGVAVTVRGPGRCWRRFEAATGFELWASDGSAAGTVQIEDLCPGPCTGLSHLTAAFDGQLYFSARPAEDQPFALYRTRGTAATTEFFSPVTSSYCGIAAVVGERLFFFTLSADAASLWSTDGTPQGTLEVSAAISSPLIKAPVVVGERLYFYAFRELWSSDGTPEGTRRLRADVDERLGAGAALDRFFFAASGADTGNALWTSDGTVEGTALVADLNRGVASSRPRLATRLAGEVERAILLADPGADLEGAVVWSVDALTGELLLLDAGIGEPEEIFATASGEALYCRDDDRRGLVSTDGLAGGTVERAPGLFLCAGFVPFDDGFLLSALGPSPGEELWFTDLTPAGTRLVKDIAESVDVPVASSRPREGVELAGSVLMSAGTGFLGEDRELWRTDGSESGTRQVREIRPRGSADPAGLTRIGDLVVFAATDDQRGRELFSSDGTRFGTRRVLDLNPGLADSNPRHFLPLDGTHYFFARRGKSDRLWRTDGTRAGTRLVAPLAFGGRPSVVGEAVATPGQIYFTLYNRRTGAELWRTDGTRRGTRQVAEIAPGRRGADPVQLTVVETASGAARLIFAADDGTRGREPWISDGSAAGTRLLQDLEPGAAASGPYGFLPLGDFVVFSATNAASGTELWAVPRTALDPPSNSNHSERTEP